MESFREAQQALAEFDKAHWQHPPGAPTIHHTFLHLIRAIAENMPYKWHDKEQRYGLGIGWGWKYEQVMPGILIEHALRIANACHEDVLEWTRRMQADNDEDCIRKLLAERKHRDFIDLFLDLVHDLRGLAKVCERVDHGEDLDRDMSMSGAINLLFYAIVLVEELTATKKHVADFLAPFERRLENLRQRFAPTST